MELKSNLGKLAGQVKALESKFNWIQELLRADKGVGENRGSKTGDAQIFSGVEVKDEKGTWEGPFDMGSFGDDLPEDQSDRRFEGKSMVMKYFPIQPTSAMIKNVLRRMECQFIEPAAIRSKRVGNEFIAVVRFARAEDLKTILRNKQMLRGTKMWVGVDRFEQEWDDKRTERPVSKPLSSYPHTELVE